MMGTGYPNKTDAPGRLAPGFRVSGVVPGRHQALQAVRETGACLPLLVTPWTVFRAGGQIP